MNRQTKNLQGLLRLMRPANLPTAVADIWAGVALVLPIPLAASSVSNFIYLSLASIFLYAAGVVLNDVFDASLDEIERPERPIPTGMVSRQTGFIFGIALMGIGILLAFFSTRESGIIALFLAFTILLYNGYAKHLVFFGPLAMGLCRGLNLLLGISIAWSIPMVYYAIIPVVYIFAVTMVSQGEVYAGNKNNLILAFLLYALVISGVFYLNGSEVQVFQVMVLSGLFIVLTYSLWKAYRNNTAAHVKNAVVAGVLGIIALDAGIAAAYAPWYYVGTILLLLPMALAMKKLFNVT